MGIAHCSIAHCATEKSITSPEKKASDFLLAVFRHFYNMSYLIVSHVLRVLRVLRVFRHFYNMSHLIVPHTCVPLDKLHLISWSISCVQCWLPASADSISEFEFELLNRTIIEQNNY